jgi:MoaA/NifB/PqqE/SkfB family radical SAM enzyme
VASWNIVATCNYRCSYCVQKKRPVPSPSQGELAGALATFARLPGRWEVKLSGGEPFVLEALPDVARGLAQAGHTVSVLTNLSAPLDRLARFVEAAGASLRTFSCSLHLEVVAVEPFLEKALAVKGLLAALPRASFVVNSVVVPGRVAALGAVRRRFEAAAVKFYPQLMRVDGEPFSYGADDLAAIAAAFGDLTGPNQMNRGSALQGSPCHAGSRYFIVHPRGDAFTCYPGKRAGDGALGNVFDGSLRLRGGPTPCPYPVCPCTVPQNRGIVGSQEAEAGSGRE